MAEVKIKEPVIEEASKFSICYHANYQPEGAAHPIPLHQIRCNSCGKLLKSVNTDEEGKLLRLIDKCRFCDGEEGKKAEAFFTDKCKEYSELKKKISEIEKSDLDKRTKFKELEELERKVSVIERLTI